MPARLYETLFMLDSTKVAADPDASRNALHAVLERYGADILVTRPWHDNQKLAYPIRIQNVTHKKGFYHAVYYRIESVRQAELERDFKLNETILRHLTSAIDAKWEDAVLDVARNEPGNGFAIRGMADETAPLDVVPNLPGMAPPGGQPPPDGGDAAPPRPRGPRREFADKPE